MQKKKLTKKQRKAQRAAAERHRFYRSAVVKCFLCGSWQMIHNPDTADYWECCCGAGGTLEGGLTETLTMTEFLDDDWTQRLVEFWTSDEHVALGVDRTQLRPLEAGPLYMATAEIWAHLRADCECSTDDQRAVADEVPDLQRVDWYVVAEAVNHG